MDHSAPVLAVIAWGQWWHSHRPFPHPLPAGIVSSVHGAAPSFPHLSSSQSTQADPAAGQLQPRALPLLHFHRCHPKGLGHAAFAGIQLSCLLWVTVLAKSCWDSAELTAGASLELTSGNGCPVFPAPWPEWPQQGSTASCSAVESLLPLSLLQGYFPAPLPAPSSVLLGQRRLAKSNFHAVFWTRH